MVRLEPQLGRRAERLPERRRTPVECVEGVPAEDQHLGTGRRQCCRRARRPLHERDLTEEIAAVQPAQRVGGSVAREHDLTRHDHEHLVGRLPLAADRGAGLEPRERRRFDDLPDGRLLGLTKELRPPQQVDELAAACAQRQPRLQLPTQSVELGVELFEVLCRPGVSCDGADRAVDDVILSCDDATGGLVPEDLGRRVVQPSQPRLGSPRKVVEVPSVIAVTWS